MIEIGPFRINSDNKTLSRNENAWKSGETSYNISACSVLVYFRLGLVKLDTVY
jgi:hypothetical protein